MLRATVLSLLVLASFAPMATASVDACKQYGVCHRVVAQPDPLLVCAGVGLGYQGVGACVLEDAYDGLCARYAVGYAMREVCVALA